MKLSTLIPVNPRATIWMQVALYLAAAYNLLWGSFVVLAPTLLFDLASMQRPTYPHIWQAVGMILAVYSIGYFLAARDPFRHWPIILIGFLGKLFGPIGFIMAVSSGALPWIAGVTIITNDIIWWIPFAAILWKVYSHRQLHSVA